MRTNSPITVITVTYNSAKDLEPFAAALSAGFEGAVLDRVIVVDNASTDNTVEMVQTLGIPNLEVVALEQNRGFGAGVNVGFDRAPEAGAYLILNPHMRLDPGCVAALAATVAKDGDVGIAAPKLVYERDGSLVYSLRREPTPLRILGDGILGGNRAGRNRHLGSSITDLAAYERATEADWATGGALLIPKSTVERIGPWDEQWFLYGEDIEYGLRCNRAGLTVRFVPDAIVRYKVGDRKASSELHTMMITNKVDLYGTTHSKAAKAAFWGAILLQEVVRSIRGSKPSIAAVKGLLADPPRP